MANISFAGCKLCGTTLSRRGYQASLFLAISMSTILSMAVAFSIYSPPEGDWFYGWSGAQKTLLVIGAWLVIYLMLSLFQHYSSIGKARYVFFGKNRKLGINSALHMHTKDPREGFELEEWIEKADLNTAGCSGMSKIYFRFRDGGYLFHFFYRLFHWKKPYNRVYVYVEDDTNGSYWEVSSWKILSKSTSGAIFLKSEKGEKVGPIDIAQAMRIMMTATNLDDYFVWAKRIDNGFHNMTISVEAMRHCATYRVRGAAADRINALTDKILEGRENSFSEAALTKRKEEFFAELGQNKEAAEAS